MKNQVNSARRRSLFWIVGVLVAPLWGTRTLAGPAAAPSTAQAPSGFLEGIYRGKLGEREIQMELVLEADAEDSFTGHYFIFGEGIDVLLAGEFDDREFSMEESRNGVDVSGNWAGTIERHTLSGMWANFEETLSLPFSVTWIAQRGKK